MTKELEKLNKDLEQVSQELYTTRKLQDEALQEGDMENYDRLYKRYCVVSGKYKAIMGLLWNRK